MRIGINVEEKYFFENKKSPQAKDWLETTIKPPPPVPKKKPWVYPKTKPSLPPKWFWIIQNLGRRLDIPPKANNYTSTSRYERFYPAIIPDADNLQNLWLTVLNDWKSPKIFYFILLEGHFNDSDEHFILIISYEW